MQNNKAQLEPAGEFPSYKEVLQDALDEIEQEAMQRMLLDENSFSESETSQNISGELEEDDEYCGPMDHPCEQCSHFLFTEYDRARDRRAQLERILAEPEKHRLPESAKLHIQDCCLGFYAGLDNVVDGK